MRRFIASAALVLTMVLGSAGGAVPAAVAAAPSCPVPIGTPISLLLIEAELLFLPTIIDLQSTMDMRPGAGISSAAQGQGGLGPKGFAAGASCG